MCAIGALISVISSPYSSIITLTSLQLAASPTTLLYASWYFCIGRRKHAVPRTSVHSSHLSPVYVNSLLAALNARKTFRGEVEELDHRMVSFPTSAASPPATSLNTRNQNISILVETTQDYEAGKTGSESSIVSPSFCARALVLTSAI